MSSDVWHRSEQTVPGAQSLEKRPPIWICCCAYKESWRNHESDELGVCHPRKERNLVGGRTLQTPNAVQRWLPFLTTQMQVWATNIPPKCLSIRHCVPVNPGGGQRLEACHYHQTDPVGYPGAAEWAQHSRSSTSRGLHNLLSEQDGLWEAGKGTGQEVCPHIEWRARLWSRLSSLN